MSVNLLTVDDVAFRIAQMTQAEAQLVVWSDELFSWQAGLTGANIEALPAGPSGRLFVAGDGTTIKGYAAERNQLMGTRAGTLFVPESGSPTAGVGFNFAAFFQQVVGLGI